MDNKKPALQAWNGVEIPIEERDRRFESLKNAAPLGPGAPTCNYILSGKNLMIKVTYQDGTTSYYDCNIVRQCHTYLGND